MPGLLTIRQTRGADLAEIDAALAVALGQSGARVASLPDTAAMDAHRTVAIETIARLAEWREPYLEALRTGRPDAGERLAAAHEWIASLDGLLGETAEGALTDLRGPVADALAAVAALDLLAG